MLCKIKNKKDHLLTKEVPAHSPGEHLGAHESSLSAAAVRHHRRAMRAQMFEADAAFAIPRRNFEVHVNHSRARLLFLTAVVAVSLSTPRIVLVVQISRVNEGALR